MIALELIDKCSLQNVENLDYENNSFGYICCNKVHHLFLKLKYVYKISFMEFEKMAVSLDLPMKSLEGFNSAMGAHRQFIGIQSCKRILNDMLCKLTLVPYQHFSFIVFKEKPNFEIIVLKPPK